MGAGDEGTGVDHPAFAHHDPVGVGEPNLTVGLQRPLNHGGRQRHHPVEGRRGRTGLDKPGQLSVGDGKISPVDHRPVALLVDDQGCRIGTVEASRSANYLFPDGVAPQGLGP